MNLKRLLAMVSIYVESPALVSVIQAVSQLPNVEELYEVTGEYDIVTLVSATDIEEFRDLLQNKIQKISGVRSTVSSIVMHTHKSPQQESEY
ncbi:MAG: Lrp/AsnC ligand binding domain-containing protein [Candidatus Bathyarchaeia archaeon]